MLGNSRVAERLEASQEGLSSMELVGSAACNDTINISWPKMDKSVELCPFAHLLIHSYEKYNHFTEILSWQSTMAGLVISSDESYLRTYFVMLYFLLNLL
jgi:hypothetical protein